MQKKKSKGFEPIFQDGGSKLIKGRVVIGEEGVQKTRAFIEEK
jgi:hypothetical protein